MKRAIAAIAALLIASGCGPKTRPTTVTPGYPCFDCDGAVPATVEVGSLRPTEPQRLATQVSSAEVVLSPKLLTATAAAQHRRSTVEAGPLAPLPEDLYTSTPYLGPTATADYGETPHFKAGDGVVVDYPDLPPSWAGLYGDRNVWVADYANIVVYAGFTSEGGYPWKQGAVLIVTGSDVAHPLVNLTPIQDGYLKIVDGKGHVLYLRSDLHNHLWSLDVDTGKLGSPPDVGPIESLPLSVHVNTIVQTSASFTDGVVSETHTAAVDWGDGVHTPGAISEVGGSGVVSASHMYASPGTYALTVTVTDSAGESTAAYEALLVMP